MFDLKGTIIIHLMLNFIVRNLVIVKKKKKKKNRLRLSGCIVRQFKPAPP